jgi:LacI family transcriptional regulator
MARRPAGVGRDATRDDVARLAGVSSAVVSYVVNDGPRPVAAATRARVLDAIEKLGYRPNTAARSLITGRSDLIGLIVPDVENQYFATLAKAVEKAAAKRGLRLVLGQAQPAQLPDLVESLASHQVDGIITATPLPPDLLVRTRRITVPLVKLSLDQPMDAVPSLSPDFYGGAQQAVRHLAEVHGHRRIALITGGEPMDVRERGWHDALLLLGLVPDCRLQTLWTTEGGRDAAALLLKDHPDATAVFAASDQQAAGLIAGLHALGRRVPDDIAIVGFDGALVGEFTVPPLTTCGVPFTQMSSDAVAQLAGGTIDKKIYPTKLIVRESCGCQGTD